MDSNYTEADIHRMEEELQQLEMELRFKPDKKSAIETKISNLHYKLSEAKQNFIDTNGKKKYLDYNGKPTNKKIGVKFIKTAIESFENMKKIQDYFIENKQWNFYLLFTLNLNTGRRISDLLNARWSDFFYKNGNMRKTWDIRKKDKNGNIVHGEQKTGKEKEVYIARPVQRAFEIFLENEKGIDFTYDYDEPVFKQLHGTHKGKVLSSAGYKKALIKASEQCLDYDEVCSHYVHRNTEEMAKLEMQYLEDFGEKYEKYVMDGEEIPFTVKKPVAVYDNAELRDYILYAFIKILDVQDKTDTVKLTELYNEILDGLEMIAR